MGQSWFKEAWRRLGTATPPFFIKLQLLGGAIGCAGTGLSIVNFPASWHFMNNVGPILTGIGGTTVILLQFVEKAQTILMPGDVLHNDTGQPVTVVTNQVSPDSIVTVPVAGGADLVHTPIGGGQL